MARKRKDRQNQPPQKRIQRHTNTQVSGSNIRYFPERERLAEKEYRPAGRAYSPVDGKKKKKKAAARRRSHRVVPLVVFLLMALYLVGQVLATMRSPDINVDTVEYGTIDVPHSMSGLIVRSEELVSADRAGQANYYFSEGDRVSKNAVVCEIKDTDTTDIIEEEIQKIDADILRSQASRSDLSIYSEDIARIVSNMKTTVESYAGKAMSSSMTYAYTLKSQLEAEIRQRNEIWLAEDVEGLSALSEEKEIYEKQLSASMSTLRASQSGVLALSSDGLEEALQPEALESIGKAQIKESAEMTYITKSVQVEVGAPMFRLVTSNVWYLVSYFPAEDVKDWSEGTQVTLVAKADEKEISLDATLHSLTEEDDEVKVVFSMTSHMSDFINQRTLNFYVSGETMEGLKIPNDAIVEKTLLKIPNEYLTESLGTTGVLVKEGETVTFVEISAIRSDEEAVYVSQDTNGLALGAVLKKTGEDGQEMTITESVPCPGVYLANSSVARFVAVTILESNQEYSIVEASSGSGGLQPFDVVVSDAKNVQEGQQIY